MKKKIAPRLRYLYIHGGMKYQKKHHFPNSEILQPETNDRGQNHDVDRTDLHPEPESDADEKEPESDADEKEPEADKKEGDVETPVLTAAEQVFVRK